MIVKVTPRNAKEKTRIAEHGDKWLVLEQKRKPEITTSNLCAALKTGHIRWFLKEQCEEVAC